MADVFLSYARESEAWARRVAEALGKAGYDVWWDSRLLPHNSYAQLIESEVRAARSVLVLWSHGAAGSQWVWAEAELARSLGKLVQARIDPCDLPLPFNQFQTARLEAWDGDAADPQWRSVLESLAELTGQTAQTATSPRSAAGSPVNRPPLVTRQRAVWAGVLGMALIVGLMGWFTTALLAPKPAASKIAVQPFETIGGGPALRDFAAGLTDSLESALNTAKAPTISRADAQGLGKASGEDQLRRLGVRLLFTGEVQTRSGDTVVRIHLDDPINHTALWTAELAAPATQPGPLEAQVAARTVAVLGCASQALRPSGGLADPAQLALYFRACELAETSGHGGDDLKAAYAMFDAFRQVIARAPDFADAHAQLAKHLAFVCPALPDDQAVALRQEADREAHRALQLDARSADAYVALGLLAPSRQYVVREALFNKALAIDPDWPHANGFLGNVLLEEGRVNDAALHYTRAAAVNPQSLDWSAQEAMGLSWTGQTDAADAELRRLMELWPNQSSLWSDRLQNLVAGRQWRRVLSELDHAQNYPGEIEPQGLTRAKATYAALLSGNRVQMAAARSLYLKDMDISDAPAVISNIALLGGLDDAFAIGERYTASVASQNDSSDFLFGPKTVALRRDPRFMALAARFGLVEVWRRTGRWPDFCRDPTLPYDCKAASSSASSPAH